MPSDRLDKGRSDLDTDPPPSPSMTAVASSPNLQSLPRHGWGNGSGSQMSMSLNGVNSDELPRMLVPRKSAQRSNSSSSMLLLHTRSMACRMGMPIGPYVRSLLLEVYGRLPRQNRSPAYLPSDHSQLAQALLLRCRILP